MKGHVAGEAQGGRSDFQISRGLNEEKSVRHFFASSINQGLGGLRGASGEIDSMDLLFEAGDEGGFGGCEEAFCGVG